jgi:hypothetical protein
MDKVQNKPNSSVQHTPSSESFQVNQKGLFGNAVLAAPMSGRKYDIIPQNGDCEYVGFSKQSPLSKRSVVTELNMENIHFR